LVNPQWIISDRGAAFTSGDFKKYCASENIEHIKITTGVSRGTGQIERIHYTCVNKASAGKASTVLIDGIVMLTKSKVA